MPRNLQNLFKKYFQPKWLAASLPLPGVILIDRLFKLTFPNHRLTE
jgi:hypothetical protein